MRARLLLLAIGLAAVVVPARAEADPIVYAHRGGAGEAPENTLGAFRRAHDLYGARGVWLEMDSQLAADGELVVIHDHTLARTTNCTGFVADRTSAQLQDCDASHLWPTWPFEPVPTLRQVLTEGKTAGWRVMVEIKNIPGERNFDPPGTKVADALLALVAETGFPKGDLLVQSFFPTSLDRVEALDPAIHTALLTTSQLPGAPPGGGFYATENAIYSKARAYEVVAPDHNSPDLRAETVEGIQALGLDVVVWTVNSTPHIDRAIGWGVDGIISDHPGLVYGALNP